MTEDESVISVVSDGIFLEVVEDDASVDSDSVTVIVVTD